MNLLYLFISCEKKKHLHIHIEYMCYLLGIKKYYIIIGTEGESYIDDHKLFVNCNDHYEGLSEKVLNTLQYIHEKSFNFDYVLKIDDDIYLNNLLFLNSIDNNDYIIHSKMNTNAMSTTWHMNKCNDSILNKTHYHINDFISENNLESVKDFDFGHGGSIYLLSKKAVNVICNFSYVDVCKKFMYEDIMVSYILNIHGILPYTNTNVSYTCYKRRNEQIHKFIHLADNSLAFRFDCDLSRLQINYITGYTHNATGLYERKSLLLKLLEEAKNEKRIAVIPKSILSNVHNYHNENISTRIVEQLLQINNNDCKYVFDDNLQLAKNHDMKRIELKHENNDYKLSQLSCSPVDKVIKNCDEFIQLLKNKPFISIHLSKTYRLTNDENNHLSSGKLIKLLENSILELESKNIYVCSDDKGLIADIQKTKSDLKYNIFTEADLCMSFDNKYELFIHEMYVVEKADIIIKTFKDSEFLYNMNSPDSHWYILNRSMHSMSRNYRLQDKIYEPNFKVKTLDNVILVLRGHIRESFKTNELYNLIKLISFIIPNIQIYIHTWNIYSHSRSWRTDVIDNRNEVSLNTIETYFKDIAHLIKKITIDDEDSITLNGNIDGIICKTLAPIKGWKNYWYGKYKACKYLYENENSKSVVINMRFDVLKNSFAIQYETILNFIKDVDLCDELNKNIFLRDKEFCGIDNIYIGNVNTMFKLSHIFHHHLDDIIDKNIGLKHQEFLVYRINNTLNNYTIEQ